MSSSSDRGSRAAGPMHPSFIGSIGALLATVLLASSCGQHVKSVVPQIVSERFKFLRDGNTTQREILDRLGDPTYLFERDHVFVYFVLEDYYGHLIVSARNRDDRLYHLVILFTSDGTMERHSLIRLR